MERRTGISAFTLKLIAVTSMFIDHMGFILFPGSLWMRCVGRLAFPVFAFQIAEGAVRTKDLGRYLARIAAFAVLAEVPFNLMCARSIIDPRDQNVLWTLLIGLTAAGCVRQTEKRGSRMLTAAVWTAAALGGYFLAEWAMTDYGGWGVVTVLVFYACRDKKWGPFLEIAAMIGIHGFALGGARVSLWGFRFPVQALAVLSLVPIALYRGRQGPHGRALRYAFYAFYPVHILVLSIIAISIGR